MEGIRYVTDDQNREIAVQIDLEKYGGLGKIFMMPLWQNPGKIKKG